MEFEILPIFLFEDNYISACLNAFLHCREHWNMKSHLSSLISTLYQMCVDAFLPCRKLWKMRSHLPCFLSMLYMICFDAFLRWRGSWKKISHMPNFISIRYTMCVCVCWAFPALPGALEDEISSFKPWFVCFGWRVLVRSRDAGNLERWDLIFHVSCQLFIGCVLTHSCAAGNLEQLDFIFQTFLRCFIWCVLM